MSDEETPQYVLRIAARALRDRDAIEARTADLEGDETALAWRFAFTFLFGSLATNPRRYAIAPDVSGFTGEVRAVTFSRDRGTAPYRLIYRVSEPQQDSPLVELLHIRHAAAKPLTWREAHEIETQNRE